MQKLHAKKTGKKIILINVNGDGAKDAAKKFHDDHKLTMEHYYVDAANDKIACGKDTGFGVQYIPHVALIGKDGKVIKNKCDAKDYEC